MRGTFHVYWAVYETMVRRLDEQRLQDYSLTVCPQVITTQTRREVGAKADEETDIVQSKDIDGVLSLCSSEAWWRDMLALTWAFRTFHARA